MNKWKQLSGNEKAMIGFILILLIITILSWGRITKGLKKGLQPYQKNTNTEKLK